jgi:hypothetical protein
MTMGDPKLCPGTEKSVSGKTVEIQMKSGI